MGVDFFGILEEDSFSVFVFEVGVVPDTIFQFPNLKLVLDGLWEGQQKGGGSEEGN